MDRPAALDWLDDLLGPTATVTRSLSGGTSRETLLVEVSDREQPLVVRRESGAGPFRGTPFSLGREAAVCDALSGRGLPISRPVAVAADGSAWAGTRLPGRPAVRGEEIGEYLGLLGALHADPPRLPTFEGFDAAGAEDPTIWRTLAEGLEGPPPLVIAALDRWRDPDPRLATLCHGDAGAGNYLVADGRVTGLLDWELAHTGDPHDDLASVLIRAHLVGHAIEGFEALVERAYRPAAGFGLDPERLLNASIGVLARMVISCHLAIASAEATKDHTTQIMGLPVMEAILLDLLARHDGVRMPVIEPPADPAYRAAIEHLVEQGDGGDPGRRRRLAYLAEQLRAVGCGDRLTAVAPAGRPDSDDLFALHHDVRARLAVLPASRALADRPLLGAPWN